VVVGGSSCATVSILGMRVLDVSPAFAAPPPPAMSVGRPGSGRDGASSFRGSGGRVGGRLLPDGRGFGRLERPEPPLEGPERGVAGALVLPERRAQGGRGPLEGELDEGEGAFVVAFDGRDGHAPLLAHLGGRRDGGPGVDPGPLVGPTRREGVVAERL